MKKLSVILCLLLVLFALSGCATIINVIEDDISTPNVQTTEIDGDLVVHFIDVGQADCILIEQDDHFMLIDAGNNDDSELVTNYLSNYGVEKLDIVIGTHPHEDHIGGLDSVISTYKVNTLIMPNIVHTSRTFQDVMDAIDSKDLTVTTPQVGKEYKLGKAIITILSPINKEYEDLNEYSVVVRLSYGETSFLFTGDAESINENEMLSSYRDLLDVDVLKVAHHGSSSSNTQAFLNQVSPSIAVIMVGANNKYGHPHDEVIDSLNEMNVSIYRADEDGTIVMTSDGKTIQVK